MPCAATRQEQGTGSREAAEAAGVHPCERHGWSVQAHCASHAAHGSCKTSLVAGAVMVACTLAVTHVEGWCWHSPAAQAAPHCRRIYHRVAILHTAWFCLLTVARQAGLACNQTPNIKNH